MVGKKAVVPPSELESAAVNYLKSLKIPEAASPAVRVEATDENLLEGGEHFNHHCAVCHDLNGAADSDFAKAFNPPVADLVSNEVQRYSDGQLKWIVNNGIRFTGMPGWTDIIDEAMQWKIVFYMRALADSEKAGQLESELEARGKWEVESSGDDHHGGESQEAGHHGDAPQEVESSGGDHNGDAPQEVESSGGDHHGDESQEAGHHGDEPQEPEEPEEPEEDDHSEHAH
jgi:mono/diheme cytochrome c family protein